MIDLIKQYEKEKEKWVSSGKPIRDKEKMREIYLICKSCPHFEKSGGYLPGYDRCGICKCQLHKSRKTLNKIAWGTTSCPKEPPSW